MNKFSISLSGDKEAIKRLSVLTAKAANLRPAMQSIGEYMLRQTRGRFDSSTAPNGSPWAPLAKSTITAKARSQNPKYRRQQVKRGRLVKRTRANPADILKDAFLLRDTIAYQVEIDSVAIGTPQRYGVFHQLGTKRMRARVFLGVSGADRVEIQAIVGDYLKK
jgi:phage virion morphogenesis protein